jgi:hypothetical protein
MSSIDTFRIEVLSMNCLMLELIMIEQEKNIVRRVFAPFYVGCGCD